MDGGKPESILAIEVGTAFTTAALFDVVEGQRRFVGRGQSPSTIYPKNADAGQGMIAAVRRLEEIVGRPLLGPRGPILPEHADGRGVDACFVLGSVGSVLRTVVIGSTAANLEKALAETTVFPWLTIAGALSLDGSQPAPKATLRELLNLLFQQRPRVLVVADGVAPKASLVELGQALTIAANAGVAPPAILFVGDGERADVLRRGPNFGGNTYCLSPTEESRAEFSPLQKRLQVIWQDIWREDVAGERELISWGDSPPAPTQQGFIDALRFWAARDQTDVWGIDVGAGTAMAVRVAGGATSAIVRPGLGAGQGGLTLLGVPAAVAQWLPFPFSPSEQEVADGILDGFFNPFRVPETTAELFRDAALAREVARRALSDLPGEPARGLLVARGGSLSNVPGVGECAGFFLDAFQPVGLAELGIDRFGILPMLGVVAHRFPDVAAELMLNDGLERLGSCIALGGTAKAESVAAKITVHRESQKVAVEVHCGEIKVLPVRHGEIVKVVVQPSAKLDAGAGTGRRVTYATRGGPLGLVIDARGRPVIPSKLGDGRAERLAIWQQALHV